jgi:hypothetical protein
MWNLRYRRARPFVSFIALATVALSLTLYSPPAACEEEATGPEESETDASSGSPKQDAQEPREAAAVPPKTRPKTPDCRSKSTEEARIIRQQGTVSGPRCENETNAELHGKDPLMSAGPSGRGDHNAEVNATIGATVLTGASGFATSWSIAWVTCTIADAIGGIDSECTKGPLTIGILGGTAFGHMGYKNDASVIILSGAVPLFAAGTALGLRMEAPGTMVYSMAFLGGAGGAYLGYRLWRIRQPTGPLKLFRTPKSIWSQVSVSPYLNRERSELVLSARF